MAESVLKHLIDIRKSEIQLNWNWEIDSAALRHWNVGYPPEDRCLKVLSEHGLTSNHIGREIQPQDFYYYDHIFGMDHSNMDELNKLAPKNSNAKIELLGNYLKKNDKIILDPYFENGVNGFRRCFEQIWSSCENFVNAQIEEIEKASTNE